MFIVDDIPELLSSSSLFSMLLPLILAYIGPVAASVPKVELQTRREILHLSNLIVLTVE